MSNDRNPILPPTGEGPTYGTLSVTVHDRRERQDRSLSTVEVTLPLSHAIKGGHTRLAAAKERVEIVEITEDTLKIRFSNLDELGNQLGKQAKYSLGFVTAQAYAKLVDSDANEIDTVTASFYLAPGVAQEFLMAFVIFAHGYRPTRD